MKKLFVEVADSHISRSYGLMDRKSLSKNSGMIFSFPHEQHLSFWMQNTYIPLDIAFIDKKGKVTQIESLNPLSTRAKRSNYICKYALEVNRGWFSDNKVKVGDYVAGDGITHRKGRVTMAQGIANMLGGNMGMDAVEMTDETPGPMGEFTNDNPPERLYVEQYPEGEEPIESHTGNLRSTIDYANENGLPMEVIYWTLGGHVLPPRRVIPIPNKGYEMKSGPNGEYMVAFDVSPNIAGAGWVLKGGQPKSFILDNIISLQIVGVEEKVQV